MAKSAEVSFGVSQISGMLRGSISLLFTRSDGAETFSHMGLTVAFPTRRPHTSGPVIRRTSPENKSRKENSKLSLTRVFLLLQRKRDGTEYKDGENCEKYIHQVIEVTRRDPSRTVDAEARL